MPLAVDLTELPLTVRQAMAKVLTDEHAAQIVLAKARQRKIAKFYHDHRPQSRDGFGGLDMAMDPFWISYFKMKYGEQSMDPDFKAWLNKKEDWFKVRHTGTKVQVGFGSTPRFHKSYGDG